jgi:hypothetical protein
VAIDKYFALVREAYTASRTYYVRSLLPRWLHRLVGAAMARRYMALSEVTVTDVLTGLTTNKDLIGILGCEACLAVVAWLSGECGDEVVGMRVGG